MRTRFLIINVNWIGDVLFSTPAIRALRKKFPESHMACLVPPRCQAILKNNPYLNELVLADDDTSFFSAPKYLGVVRRLRRCRFDQAIFFHRSRTKAFLTRLAGIPERVRAHRPPAGLHRIDYFLGLLESLGVEPDGRSLDFFPSEEAAGELEGLLGREGIGPHEPYAVVHAGGNWELKRWPWGYFVEWIRLFLRECRSKVVLCGTSPEEPLARQIQAHFQKGEVVSLCGKTTLDMLALLLKRAEFLLSNDSGPVHLASSQGTRILALFGPTSPDVTGPVLNGVVKVLRKDVGCEVPCYFRSCTGRVCMDWLAPEEVFEKTKELLNA